jgi:hypothetical protein
MTLLAGGVAQMIDCLLHNCKALSSNPILPPEKKNENDTLLLIIMVEIYLDVL